MNRARLGECRSMASLPGLVSTAMTGRPFARAATLSRREYDAAHPRVKEPPVPAPAQDVATLIQGWPAAAPKNHSDLF